MLKKVSIYVYECTLGMKIAESVFSDYGATIVAKDTTIDDNVISKLTDFGIEKVLVYEVGETINERKDRVRQEYETNVDEMKNVLKEIGSGKNLDVSVVHSIVETIMESKKENIDIIYCINTVRDVQEYTYSHSVNVALLCMMIGKWLNLPVKIVKELVLCGLLHDVGKTKIDLKIIDKPNKLDDDEYEEIKKHVLYGYRFLDSIPEIDKKVALAVLMHHERDDGSGYLIGAKAEQIPHYAKILAIADVFDAMTSDRVYRKKQSPFEVFEHIERGTFGKFDPEITLIFLNHMANYYVGDNCRLSNDKIAEIIKINPSGIAYPLVKVEEEYIDLSKNRSLKIVEML